MRCGRPYRFPAQTSVGLLAIFVISCGGKGPQSSSGITSQQTPSQQVSISVSPNSVGLDGGQSQQFTATVNGSSNTSVQWSVNGIAGGSGIVGRITASGLYVAPIVPLATNFTITATSANDPSKSASAVASVAPVSLTISPSAIALNARATQQFRATVTGAIDAGVTWTVNQTPGGNSLLGTVDASGLYTAPDVAPALTVALTATSHADSSKSASATITLGSVAVAVSPGSAILGLNATRQFTATVSGNVPGNNTAVSWSLSNPGAGGQISPTGFYTAPPAIPSPAMVTVTATSQADATKSASALITIEIDNKLAQTFPIKLGTSGGNSTDSTVAGSQGACCSGTLGALASRAGNQYILSTSRVLNKSGQGALDDPISQPGLVDAQCDPTAVTTVAKLSQAAPLQTATGNADAAMAQVLTGAVDPSGAILDLSGIGKAAPPSAMGIADPLSVLMMNGTVAKSGAGSGLTCGTINSIDNTIQVDYQTECGGTTSFPVTYNGQVVITNNSFGVPGDSGSLVVSADNARPLGLLIAAAGNIAFATPIQTVLNALADTANPPNLPAIVGGPDHPVECPAPQSQMGLRSAGRPQLRDEVMLLPSSELQRANISKLSHAAELMRDPDITGLDVAASEDDPREAAIVVYSKTPQPHISHLLDGVRTRVVFSSDSQVAQSGVFPRMTREELQHGMAVKAQHVDELMSNPAIIGVGVGASHDNPNESALVIFIEQGKQASVPAEIDGMRTRIQFTDRFRAFAWDKNAPKSCSPK
jgi:hypothetical protein